ncbi:hypothetical protein B0A48_11789 [Cryoendolithus antarcticus]|uniref:Myb-like DNA-binding protein myb-1 n=1 Tax=Cryoendolithus antarcticus TaxID=1507870 RepID=A0A1V8SSR8_9PEZI|nr:hypothetical protein B0A48_11789 [Cryoendolithus antarcticus]
MPQHKRGPWSATEDQYLLHLVNLHGAHNWVRISSIIASRSPKQCRERFHQNLKPNLNHDPITPEEGLLIEQMVAEMGKRWAEIARRLRGRSDNAVKNWFNGGINRRRRSNGQRRPDSEARSSTQQLSMVPQQSMPGMFRPPPIPQISQRSLNQHPMSQQQTYQSHGLPQTNQSIMQAGPSWAQPMSYQPQTAQWSQHMGLPPHVPVQRLSGTFDTPLPSPSAFSQMSADGAPSLVSDRSSMSMRSPHNNNNNGSPIELPPLSGHHNEQRPAPQPQLNMTTQHMYYPNPEVHIPTMQVSRYEEQIKEPQVLQEAFVSPQPQVFELQRSGSMPQSMQVYQAPQPYQAPMYADRQQAFYQQSGMASSVQLPRISGMSGDSALQMSRKPSMLQIDPVLHGTPIPSVHTPEGSPKDKMKLSNITL